MAQYKVPQDVEAEDKLIGWLSFRQLIYAGIAVGSAAMAFFLYQIFPLFVLIPLPFVFLFGILVLPLRKDQPLETYLIAVVRFYLKPKIRRWDPDGVISYVEITAPSLIKQNLSKSYGAEGAQERLDYLARIMDSRGWAYKDVAAAPGTNLSPDVAAEASTAPDILDEHANLSRSMQNLIQRKDEETRQTVLERMQHAQSEPGSSAGASQAADDAGITPPVYNPYPASMHQKVILPQGQQPPAPPPKPVAATVTPPMPPAIIDLARNKDLSVSAIAHEAKRLENKEENEVVIKLR